MSTKAKMEQVVGIMRKWQKAENAAVHQTSRVMEETDNPLVRLVMEIIQRDSNLHHRVQQLVVDSIEREFVPVHVQDLEKVWTGIEKHIQVEKQTIELATQALAALEGTKSPVQQYLISYLLEDEKKHDKLLEDLSKIKKGIYPY